MDSYIEVRKSNKYGLNSEESYIVIRDKTVFLRLLGRKSIHGNVHQYELMTATASEDDNHIKACRNQEQLLKAFNMLADELGTGTLNKSDRCGRPYIKIHDVTSDHGDDQGQLFRDLTSCNEIKRFFELYDEQLRSLKAGGEIREIYDGLSIDDSGSDVYLSDGVWLSQDGTLHDNGR
ncbi:hypothetical protein ACK303_13490 [Aeromonas caviae]|uniref:hypothetical protein n=1 Tax=Aeromonas caviae TaxID=648 RepID=UPI0020B7C63C|nr:hypothetical protein [Aeromonas caviae]UTI03812.1 hypothetical protein NJR02_06495 [Aeromonas caviae]